MGKWLKKIPAKRPWIEDNINNVNNKNMAELMFLLLLA